VDQPNSDAALMALNESAHLEYGTDFITAIDTPDEELTLRRMARLTGIEMKRPFATPIPIIGPSETGASQQWLLNQEFVGCPDADAPAFDGIKGDRSYKLMVRIYEELQNQNDPDTMGMTFGGFLENNHSESNWLLAALRAAQPYFCEKPGVHVSKPTTPEKRRELWGLAKEAAEGLATESRKPWNRSPRRYLLRSPSSQGPLRLSSSVFQLYWSTSPREGFAPPRFKSKS
jgi:hypothetical protein